MIRRQLRTLVWINPSTVTGPKAQTGSLNSSGSLDGEDFVPPSVVGSESDYYSLRT